MHPTGSVSILSSLADRSALIHCPACFTVLFQSLAAPRPLTVWNSFGVSHAPLSSTRRSRARSLPEVLAPRYSTASFSPHVIVICRSELNVGTSVIEHQRRQGAITSKIKHAMKLKTSPARLAQLLQLSSAFCFSLQPMTVYRPGLEGTPSLAAS